MKYKKPVFDFQQAFFPLLHFTDATRILFNACTASKVDEIIGRKELITAPKFVPVVNALTPKKTNTDTRLSTKTPKRSNLVISDAVIPIDLNAMSTMTSSIW